VIVAQEAEGDIELTAELAPLDPGLFLAEDFTSTPVGWVVHGAWVQGTPSGGGGEPEPDAGGCVATVFGGPYPNNMTFANDYVQTPSLDLRGATAPVLQFRAWLQTSAWEDGGHVEIATDPAGPWTTLEPPGMSPTYDGSVGGGRVWWGDRVTWRDHVIPLSAHVGSVVWLRFAMYSDSWSWDPRQGWFIDNVMVIDP
jgi:hypothetical protein